MSHTIEALKPHLTVAIGQLRREWYSGKYQRLKECPSHAEAKALARATRVLEAYYYGSVRTPSLRQLIKEVAK